MSENCSDCKDSILSNQKSTLPDPQCQGDCPEISCNGIGTYTDCVILNDTYSCIVPSGSTLSEALEEINTKLCQNIVSSCGVQITTSDSCCGTLGNPSGLPDSQGNKIRSESLAINIEGPSGTCQYLSIEEKDWTWTNLNLGSNYTNGAPGSIPPIVYANPSVGIKNDEVRFRGLIKVNTYNSYINQTATLPVLPNNLLLPLQFRPSETKVFQFVGNVSGIWVTVSIIIYNTGLINTEITRMYSPNPSTYTGLTISLDHISYIK